MDEDEALAVLAHLEADGLPRAREAVRLLLDAYATVPESATQRQLFHFDVFERVDLALYLALDRHKDDAGFVADGLRAVRLLQLSRNGGYGDFSSPPPKVPCVAAAHHFMRLHEQDAGVQMAGLYLFSSLLDIVSKPFVKQGPDNDKLDMQNIYNLTCMALAVHHLHEGVQLAGTCVLRSMAPFRDGPSYEHRFVRPLVGVEVVRDPPHTGLRAVAAAIYRHRSPTFLACALSLLDMMLDGNKSLAVVLTDAMIFIPLLEIVGNDELSREEAVMEGCFRLLGNLLFETRSALDEGLEKLNALIAARPSATARPWIELYDLIGDPRFDALAKVARVVRHFSSEPASAAVVSRAFFLLSYLVPRTLNSYPERASAVVDEPIKFAEIVAVALRTFLHSDTIAYYALQAVVPLVTATTAMTIVEAGLHRLAFTAMTVHRQNMGVVEHAAQVLHALATFPEALDELVNPPISAHKLAVELALELHQQPLDLRSRYTFHAVLQLIGALAKHDTENTLFGEPPSPVVALVYRAWDVNPDPTLISGYLMVLSALARYANHQGLLAEDHVDVRAVAAMDAHRDAEGYEHDELHAFGCRLIGGLARDESARARMMAGDAAACVAVCEAMQAYTYVELVQQFGVDALAQLSRAGPDACWRMMSESVRELAVDAREEFPNNDPILNAATTLLERLDRTLAAHALPTAPTVISAAAVAPKVDQPANSEAPAPAAIAPPPPTTATTPAAAEAANEPGPGAAAGAPASEPLRSNAAEPAPPPAVRMPVFSMHVRVAWEMLRRPPLPLEPVARAAALAVRAQHAERRRRIHERADLAAY